VKTFIWIPVINSKQIILMAQLSVVTCFCVYIGKNTANTGGHNTKATDGADSNESQTGSSVSGPVDEWCEATTPEGYVYYWNTVTRGDKLRLFILRCFNPSMTTVAIWV